MFSVNSVGHPAERDGSAFGGTSPGIIRGERPRLHRKHLIRVDLCASVVALPQSDSGARSFFSPGVYSWLVRLIRVISEIRGSKRGARQEGITNRELEQKAGKFGEMKGVPHPRFP